MNKSMTIVLRALVVLLGLGIVSALLWEPWVEGVNASATGMSQIYFDDPFLAYIYFSFIAVFVGLYQLFKLLGNIGSGVLHSQSSVKALRTIKYCGMIFAGMIFGALVYLFIAIRGTDDIAGGVATGLFLTLSSLAVATVAGILERKFQAKL